MKCSVLLFLFGALNWTAWSQQFDVLLYTRTNGYHHRSIAAGVAAVEKLAKLHDFSVYWTENPDAAFKEGELEKYEVVVFLNTVGDVLNDEQQAVFESFIKNGGGFVGVHSASDTEYGWEWYTKMVGRMFHIHPPVQTAIVNVENRKFPGMERFTDRFLFTDEWYEYDAPRGDGITYLLSVDEKTYNPEVDWGVKSSKGMGDFHPVSWYRNYDGGRAFFTGLGHLDATFEDDGFLHHLYGGIYWAATGNNIH